MSLGNRGNKPKKKPAASSTVAKSPQKKPAQKAKAAVPKKAAKQSEKSLSTDKGDHKSSFRHRKTSTAYHSARNAAEAQGKSEEEAKQIGREASRKMGANIDAGLVKEP